MKSFLIIFCSLFFFLNNSFARVTATSVGEYRTVASGNWNDLSTWQVKLATNSWATPSTLPDSTTSVYIQYGHTITISSTDATCFNLNICNALVPTTIYQLILSGAYNLNIYGQIRAFSSSTASVNPASDGITDGTSYTFSPNLVDMISTQSTGVLKFVGGTFGVARNFAISNVDWNSGGTRCNVEFSLNQGAIITNNSGLKFKKIVLSSGQLTSTSFISAGQEPGDSLIIKNGAYLLSSRSGAASQVIAFTSSSGNPCNNITIEKGGTLELTGASPYIDTKSFNNNGTVIYSCSTSTIAQTLLQPTQFGITNGAAYISNYKVLILKGGLSASAAYSKTIPKCTNSNSVVDSTIFISDTLRLNGNRNTYFVSTQGKIVYGPNATLVFDPSANLSLPVNSIEWPAVGAPKKILFQRYSCGIASNATPFGAGDRTIKDTIETVNGALQINNNNALYLDSGSTVNIRGAGGTNSNINYTSSNVTNGTLIYAIGTPSRGAGQKVNVNINSAQVTLESKELIPSHNYGRINLSIGAGSTYNIAGGRTIYNLNNNGIFGLTRPTQTTTTIKGDISGNGYIFSQRNGLEDSATMSLVIDSATTNNTTQYLNFYPNQDLFGYYQQVPPKIDTIQLRSLTINRYGTEYIINTPLKIYRGLSLRNGILNDNGNVISVGGFIGKDSVNASGPHLAYHKTNNNSPGKIKLLCNYTDPSYNYIDSVRLANLDILGDTKLIGSVTVDTLNLYGKLVTDNNTLNCLGKLNRYNGWIVGKLKKYFSNENKSQTFELGNDTYTPVTMKFGALTAPGSLTVSQSAGIHPNIISSPLSQEKLLNSYWTIANENILFDTCNAIFTFSPTGILNNADVNKFSIGKYNLSSWTKPTTSLISNESIQAKGLTSFGDFQIGESNCTSYGIDSVFACDSLTWHGTTFTSSNNTATWTTTNNLGCDSVVQLKLTIYPSHPTINIFSNKLSSCYGDTIIFSSTVSSGISATQYQWQKNNINISGANASTYKSSTLTSNDIITCILLNCSNQCNPNDTITSNSITINVLVSTPSVTLTNPAVCAGSGAVYKAVPTNGGAGPLYTFYKNANVVQGPSAVDSLITIPNASDVIKVKLKSNFACLNPDTAIAIVTVNLKTLPIAPVTGNSTSRCGIGALTLTATPGAGETIDWYAAASGGSALLIGSSSYNTPSISATTTYYATSRTLSTGCVSSSRSSVVAIVNAQPNAGTLSGNSLICLNATSTYTSTVLGGTWSSSDTGVAKVNAAGLIIPVSPGTANIVYTVAGSGGCTNASVSKAVTVLNGTFTSSAITSCDNYQWQGTTYTSSGNFVYYYNNTNGCPSTDTLHLTIRTSTHNVVTISTTDSSYLWNGVVYKLSGNYLYNYINGISCASVDTLHLNLLPSIISFTPTIGFYGSSVLIKGTNFTGATSVKFGNVNALGFEVISSSQITATVSQGASGIVSVTTPKGMATLSGFVFYGTPQVNSFTPTIATNRAAVIIKGRNFRSVSAVKFGSTNAYSFTTINDSTISAVVGTGSSGAVSITTPGGTGSLSGFTYVASAPSIYSFTPAVACSTGVVVTIKGLNLLNTLSLIVGGVSTNYTILSDTTISFTTNSSTNSGLISIANAVGTVSSANNFIMSGTASSLVVNPNPFNLCGGLPRKLNTNLPNIYNYSCSNGQNGSSITISNTGSYTLTATDANGCVLNTAFTVNNYTNCGGYLEIESDSLINYFDTLHVKVKIKNGVNIFSVFAYLNFNNNHLRLINSQVGDYLGSNLINQTPIITGGQIDFGMSKVNGEQGSNGDGLIYQFDFVMIDQLPTSTGFSEVFSNYFVTNLNLSNLSVYNASGTKPPSFDALTTKDKSVACRYYIPVWPGDLNGDKKVSVSDILPIGYFYGSTGPVRPNASLQWQAQASPLWGFDKTTKSSSAYKTFADGTADGIINLADQTSIGFNLGRNHARYAAGYREAVPEVIMRSNTPSLNINIADSMINQTDLPLNEMVNVTIGSSALPLNNLYGIAFDLYFDPAYVNTAGISTNYSGSIFGTQGVDFTKIEDKSSLSTGRLSIGITRFNTTAITASGGTALNITIPLLANAPSGVFKIIAVPTDCNNPLGNSLVINGGSDSLIINGTPCDINYWIGEVSSAWENPANWSCGLVPDATTEVRIESGKQRYPEVNSQAACKKLITADGTTLKVNSGYNLNIVGHN